VSAGTVIALLRALLLSGGARFDDGAGGDNEVQRTMLEIVNQLDGFDARGNVKVGAQCTLCIYMAAMMFYVPDVPIECAQKVVLTSMPCWLRVCCCRC
jgi:hypothetical protein